jgi:hypothetical protein
MIDLRNKPLLDTTVDAALFVPPSTLGRIETALGQGLNVAVLGDRGVGKTSMLRQLTRHLRECGKPVAFVSAEPAEGAAGTLIAIREQLADAAGVPQALQAAAVAPVPSDRPSDLARSLAVDAAKPGTVVVVDGIDAETGHELFGRLRDVLWQAPVSWVVAARSNDRGMLAPPADAFFEQVTELAPLEVDQIDELLARRLGVDAAKIPVNEIAQASNGNPRRALELAREIVIGRHDLASVLEQQARREHEASRLGRAPSMLLAEIEQLGRPVWSSDDELLARMGWTRNRAVQVLGQLAERPAAQLQRSRSCRRCREDVHDQQAGHTGVGMSASTIKRLDAKGAFEPAEDFGELSDRHVKFDDLVGDQRREARLAALLGRSDPVKVAVRGPSGSGKSSMIAATLAELPYHLPLPIAVAAADMRILESQTEFGHFIIQELHRQAKDRFAVQAKLSRRQKKALDRASADETTRTSPGAKVTLTAGIPKYANLAAEVSSAITASNSHTTPSRSLVGLAEVARIFAADGMPIPVLIIDDADKWASAHDPHEADRRAELLFSTVLQPLLKLPMHLVVAVQDHWVTLPQYENLRKRLHDTIAIPVFTDALDALGQIIAHRALDLDDPAERNIDALLDGDALTRLEAEYDHADRSIRHVLRVLDIAVKNAAAAGQVPDHLTRLHIRAASLQVAEDA